MNPERFATGLTYATYRDQLTQNRARFDAHEKSNLLDPADIAAFAALRDVIRTVVLTEDWCSDAVATLPLVAALAERSGKLDLRVFLRDKNLDLMDAHLNQGKFRSIPTFIFYDERWNEIGALIEKPASIATLRARLRLELYASAPAYGSPDAPLAQLPDDVRARFSDAYWQLRDDTTPLSNREVIREMRGLLLKDAP